MPMKTARQHLGVDATWMILFVGRIEPLKGVDTFIRAMALLANQCPRRSAACRWRSSAAIP